MTIRTALFAIPAIVVVGCASAPHYESKLPYNTAEQKVVCKKTEGNDCNVMYIGGPKVNPQIKIEPVSIENHHGTVDVTPIEPEVSPKSVP